MKSKKIKLVNPEHVKSSFRHYGELKKLLQISINSIESYKNVKSQAQEVHLQALLCLCQEIEELKKENIKFKIEIEELKKK